MSPPLVACNFKPCKQTFPYILCTINDNIVRLTVANSGVYCLQTLQFDVQNPICGLNCFA